MVVCMNKAGSKRLSEAQYIQCDIGFKRVVGFYEFELAAMDRDANTSNFHIPKFVSQALTRFFSGVVFCRIYLNRQSAAAHHLIFQEIEKVVCTDTGQTLQWRHLHAKTLDDYGGCILHVALDQHGGQAKGILIQQQCQFLFTISPGLGLHLQERAREQPDRFDLHETQRLLISLTEYEHLHRLARLCTVHGKRNIRKCPVPEAVKNLMRSLMCLEHPDWDGTLRAIEKQGGKAGQGICPNPSTQCLTSHQKPQ